MKVFIEAFVDTNFGDNLFVHTVVTRYPQCTFYLSLNEGYECSYELLAEQEQNVCLIRKAEEPVYLPQMDGMIFVGGDLFWNWGHYESYIEKIRIIKERRGFVIFLGQSLFKDYSFETRMDLGKMFSRADSIVMREEESYQQVRKIAPFTKAFSSTDMAFAADVERFCKSSVEKGVLGISVRKKIPRESKDTYEQYCDGIAEIVSKYLDQSQEYKVRFLVLSTGEFDDRVVANDIMTRCSAKYRHRMSVAAFDGNVDSYIEEMQKCEKMICTRFHALVFGILLGKTVLPIVYEDKMERLLNSIAYEGIRFKYEEVFDVSSALKHLQDGICSMKRLDAYKNNARNFFNPVDQKIKAPKSSKRRLQWGAFRAYYIISKIMHIMFAKIR